MRVLHLLTAGAVAVATLGVTAAAANPQLEAAVRARKAQMQLYGFNVGILGGMAQGNIPYDAATAQAAADNLVALASLSKTLQWPEGSDNAAMPDSRALPALWANLDDFAAKYDALATAAAAMQGAAGQGLDALKGAMGGIGAACAACHEAYRAPQ